MIKSELEQKINEANTAYAAGIPFITDYEYDQLWQQLYYIDPTNSLLYHTAQQRANLTGASFHKYPIYGTNKAFNMIDLNPFLTRFGDQLLMIEPKYDGCAAVITHTEPGWQITLEGDGRSGKDVTHMLNHISCDFQLRHFQAVEIIIPFKDWQPEFGKNPRNVVAGWLARKYDPPPINMTAIPHDFGQLFEEYSYSGDLNTMGEFLLKLFSKWSQIYPMDGLMIKPSDSKVRLIAGNNGQTNNWSIAWKPPIQTKQTTVVDIEWNVSRLGRVIPTVLYEPIELCSTTNSRVTGNNAQWVSDKQIKIGSTLLVGKAGEIIPKILEVENSQSAGGCGSVQKTCVKAPNTAKKQRLDTYGSTAQQKTKGPKNGCQTPLPAYCPKCGEPLTWEGVHLICTGPKCLAKIIVSVAYFYSHKGIKIDGIGEAMIEKLLNNEKLYKVLSNKPWALLDIESYTIMDEVHSVFGSKIFINIMEQIHNVYKIKTMAHFIAGLGLPGLAYKTSLRLCQFIKTGKLNIPVSYQARQSFFKAVVIFNDVQIELKNFAFAPLPNSAKAIYCITGTLEKSREATIEYLNSYGYEFSANVTRETNYLIVGEAPGKLKRKFAEKYKIPQITERQLIQLLEKE